MDKAVAELEALANTNDIYHINRVLDIIIDESSRLDGEALSAYALDPALKRILRNNKRIEVVEKIGDLFSLIRDPRNFHDELVELLDEPCLMIPTLMLMFELSQDFDFEYADFYVRLAESLTIENVQSEGFLLFVLRCLNKRTLDLPVLELYLRRLSQLSVAVPSGACIKIVYCILVIMRMHPASFAMCDELKELHILACSFESIKNIVQRIFIEARCPKKRPKVVFLQNFAFPELDL